MKKHSFMSIISLLLVICLPLSIVPITAFAEENNSTSGLEDLIAGISSVEDIYGELDRETVPEIIGYDYAVSKAHVQRLYEAEDDDLNRFVFLNADGTQTAYIFDFPVKYIDERGEIKDITLDIAESNTLGQFETASGSSVTTFSRNASDGIRLVGNDTMLSLVPHIPVTRSGAELSSSSKITASSTVKRIDNKTVSYDYDSKTTIEYRKHPVTGANYSSHGGIDIPASSGTQLYSVFDGQVKVIGYESNSNSGRGHYIIVEATNDYNNVYLSSQKLRYVYMHMKESPTVTNSQVVKNAYVDINTLIGKVGTTGASTGNHLHLSFIVNGGTSSAIENVVNPMMFYPDIDFTY